MAKRRAQAIATRTLKAASGGGDIAVSLGKPFKIATNHWGCPYWIVLSGKARGQKVGEGVDAFQALIMALEGIRHLLINSGKSYSWVGGEGQTGFPAYVPIIFGREFELEVTRIVAQATERNARKLIARGKKRSPRARSE